MIRKLARICGRAFAATACGRWGCGLARCGCPESLPPKDGSIEAAARITRITRA